MQIVFHLGAHVTDEARAQKALRENAARLADQGIAVPRPEEFRAPLAEALRALQAGAEAQAVEDALLSALLGGTEATRLVISVDSLLCPADQVLGKDRLYPMAGPRTARLAALFPGHRVEFHIGLRNPATFLPALHRRAGGGDFADFLADADLQRLRWSDVLRRIAEATPAARLVAWANEDTPFIWPMLLRSLSAYRGETPLDGGDALIAGLLTEDGMARMTAYLDSHPPRTETQRRRILGAFLEKFARPGVVEMDLGDTGWTTAEVEQMTQAYELDLVEIERMSHVTFLAP